MFSWYSMPSYIDQSAGLHRLAQAHVIGQDASLSTTQQPPHPCHTLALVGAQLLMEALTHLKVTKLHHLLLGI